MHALSAAHELRLDSVIDQLLQDFLQVCPDDYSSQFVTECLPLLFNIFRYSKVSARLIASDCQVERYLLFVYLHFAERGNDFAVSRYICNLLWMGANKTD